MKFDARTLFRTVAVTEAVTWAGLLVGMYFKWIAGTTEIGVKVGGQVHGIVVLIYVGTVLYARTSFRWDMRTFLLALVASVPPLATLVFGFWADRRDLLQSPSSPKEKADITN
jgi:integral membrane protein